MLSYPGRKRQRAGRFVILRESPTVVAPVPGRFLGYAGIAGNRLQFGHAAALAAVILRGIFRVFGRGKGF